jgi:hypothetical protein
MPAKPKPPRKPQPTVHSSTTKLSAETLARAVATNPSWASKLGWIRYTDAVATLTGAPPTPSSQSFALAIAGWQAIRGLDVDGILGPITWGEMRQMLVPPDSLTGIVPPDTPPPPDGFDAIIGTFGDPRPLLEPDGTITDNNRLIWERQTLGRGTLAFGVSLEAGQPSAGVVHTFQAHRRLVSVFEAAFGEVARLGLQGEIHSWGGIYNFRPIRGITGRLSLHAFGAAVDVNPETNALGTEGDMSPRVVEVFRHFGFRWGGEFAGRPDPMHFQYATGY